MVRRSCEICGREFEVAKSEVKRGNGKFCSKECYGKYLKRLWQDVAYKEKRVERIKKGEERVYKKVGYKVLEVWKSEIKTNPVAVVNKIVEYFYGEN
jgi:G:T-mismatch repair DNA endonuclease (very short patch repair protein)